MTLTSLCGVLKLCCNSATGISHLPVYEVPVSSLNGEYWSWLKSSARRSLGPAGTSNVSGGCWVVTRHVIQCVHHCQTLIGKGISNLPPST